jgi:hypothetical protein
MLFCSTRCEPVYQIIPITKGFSSHHHGIIVTSSPDGPKGSEILLISCPIIISRLVLVLVEQKQYQLPYKHTTPQPCVQHFVTWRSFIFLVEILVLLNRRMLELTCLSVANALVPNGHWRRSSLQYESILYSSSGGISSSKCRNNEIRISVVSFPRSTSLIKCASTWR